MGNDHQPLTAVCLKTIDVFLMFVNQIHNDCLRDVPKDLEVLWDIPFYVQKALRARIVPSMGLPGDKPSTREFS
ncbi:hypothetical protein AK95_17180 [Paenibacillus sp. LC231]|nr:hypothetical protein AK95_17180 [Paenibacillus sp. LC231]